MIILSFSEVRAIWISAGGAPANADQAAAVAYAESGGAQDATNMNANGTVDRGLWQINSIHGDLSTLDPIENAKAAIELSDNGESWHPWCTAYTDGACGTRGGVYAPDTVESPAGRMLALYVDQPPTIGFMQKGQTSPEVFRLQEWLNRTFPLYSRINPTSGYYGDQTTAVVREFQRRAGITGSDADGTHVGPRTVAALIHYGFQG